MGVRVGSRRLLSLSDALVLLGADPPRLAALDRSLGGVLAVATGGVSDGLLRIADARGRILGLGRDAVRGVGARLGAADGRVERGEMLRAAHTVVVVLGWFEALAEQDLPFSLEAVRITRGDQLSLVGAGEADAGFARALAAVDAPFPAPHLAPEDAARELLGWYTALSGRFLRFVSGLAVWDTLTPAGRDAAERALTGALPGAACVHYDSLYAQLAQQAPEFGFWATLTEHRATRAGVQRALAGIEALLAGTASHALPPWMSRPPWRAPTRRRSPVRSWTRRRRPTESAYRPWRRCIWTRTSGCGRWPGSTGRRTRHGGNGLRCGRT